VILAREEEWKRREEHNDAAAMSWAIEAPDGWGSMRPASPVVEEGWPGTWPEDWCFPRLEDMPLRPNGWPDLSLPTSTGVQVTIEVKLTIEEVEGHSACRLLMSIVRLSVPDLLSFLYHSTVSISVPLVILVGELTRSESTSGGTSCIAVDISNTLGESLSEIWARYFRDSDESNKVEQVLVEEQDHL
jgi:hypothetical protein